MTVLSIILFSLALPSEAFVAPITNTVRPSFAHCHFSTGENKNSVQDAAVDAGTMDEEETSALQKAMDRIDDSDYVTRLSRVKSRLSTEPSNDKAEASEKVKPETAQAPTIPEKNEISEKVSRQGGPNVRVPDVTSFPESAASLAAKDAMDATWQNNNPHRSTLDDLDAGSWWQGSGSPASSYRWWESKTAGATSSPSSSSFDKATGVRNHDWVRIV